MPNYANGKIYTIRCRSDDTLIYVGSTTQELSQRLAKHRSDCKKGRCCSLYNKIINSNWDDWYIELYEVCSSNSKEELGKKEGEVIRQIGTINKNIAGRTNKEWYKDNADKIKEIRKEYREDNADKIKENKKEYSKKNAEKIKEYKKNWREDNAEKIKERRKEKVCCDICGAFSRKGDLAKHQRTKKCMDVASKK